MAADVDSSLASWSTTEGSNKPTGTTSIGANLDDNLRRIQAIIRYIFNNDTIASASTTDLGSKESGLIGIAGTTTIASFGTVSAGIRKWVYFTGALTLTYNGTSMILPTAADILTANGDCALFVSLGSGNWRCLSYMRANGQNIAGTTTFGDGSAGSPSMAFTLDTNTGFYRIGSDNVGLSLGGTKRMDFSATAVQFTYTVTSSIGNAVTLRSAPGNAITLAGGDSASATSAGGIVISGGNHTAGGAGGVRGDVTIAGGNQTFVSGSSGDRGGNVVIAGGDCSDPAGASSGEVVLKAGGVASNAVPGSLRMQDSGGTDLLVVSANRKTIAVGGAAPTVASGAGTGPSIAGKTNAFKLTLGTSPGTTVVLNLPDPVVGTDTFANAPVVVANYETGNIAVRATATVTQITLTFASTPANGGVVHVICLGYE